MKSPGQTGQDRDRTFGKNFVERLPNHWKILLVLVFICLCYGLVFLGTARAQAPLC